MADALVAVDEGMIRDQGEAKGGGLVDGRRVQFDSAERSVRLCQRRLEKTKIAEARGAAGLLQEAAVKVDDLPQREVAHHASRR
jgi:hypothetical protein